MEFLLLWEKLFKFGIVGVSGIGVDFGITYLSKDRLLFNKYLANSVGFIAAATTNYLLNRYWTFESSSVKVLMQYISFMVIAVCGLIINNFIIYLSHQRKGWLKFYMAKIFATGVVFLWNFTLNYLVTFSI